MVLRCVVYGCNNKKDLKNGISIHEILFYEDRRPEAVKRRRKWISFVNNKRKNWTPNKRSLVCSVHFSQEDFSRFYSFKGKDYQQGLKRDEVGVVPFPQLPDHSTRKVK